MNWRAVGLLAWIVAGLAAWALLVWVAIQILRGVRRWWS
jgi:hypothetical protein